LKGLLMSAGKMVWLSAMLVLTGCVPMNGAMRACKSGDCSGAFSRFHQLAVKGNSPPGYAPGQEPSDQARLMAASLLV